MKANIRLDRNQYYIYQLYKKYIEGKLSLNSQFNVPVKVSVESKSRVIESIFLGLTVGSLYLRMLQNTDLEVIDGNRRLSAIFDFMGNNFQLTGLELFPDVNGKNFEELKEGFCIYRNILEDTLMDVVLVMPPTSDGVIFEIIERVNKG